MGLLPWEQVGTITRKEHLAFSLERHTNTLSIKHSGRIGQKAELHMLHGQPAYVQNTQHGDEWGVFSRFHPQNSVNMDHMFYCMWLRGDIYNRKNGM